MSLNVVVRGGGDLASGAILRMHRIGIQVLVCELPQPFAVRRTVSFAEAIFSGSVEVEETQGVLINSPDQIQRTLNNQFIPVLVDPDLSSLATFKPNVIVDGRMTKAPEAFPLLESPFLIGLGPGFCCGINCQAAVETKRGSDLGRIINDGCTEEDTGQPEVVLGRAEERVLRAPTDGIFRALAEIGDCVVAGQAIAEVNQIKIRAAFDGMVRGMLHDGLSVTAGVKVGDLDPRMNPILVQKVSDKALAIGGGVVEAILSRPEFRKLLW